ncbi:MAG: hypothetical protein LCH54_18025 [Bacteroidetes bacterium]|nr:hypothetical protein [Bacteroidota bacterium]
MSKDGKNTENKVVTLSVSRETDLSKGDNNQSHSSIQPSRSTGTATQNDRLDNPAKEPVTLSERREAFVSKCNTNLQPCDIIHVRTNSMLGKLIRFFSKEKDGKPSWASHTAMVLEVEENRVLIIEALATIKIHPLDDLIKSGNAFKIDRISLGLTQGQQLMVTTIARRYEGRKYGYPAIAAHFADWFLGGRYLVRKWMKMENYPICSWLVAYSYLKGAGIRLTPYPEGAQPDDIMEFCESNYWQRIYEKE